MLIILFMSVIIRLINLKVLGKLLTLQYFVPNTHIGIIINYIACLLNTKIK